MNRECWGHWCVFAHEPTESLPLQKTLAATSAVLRAGGAGRRGGAGARFLSDGATVVRNLERAMHPNAEHILHWFHVAIRPTALEQCVRGIVRIEKDADDYGADSIGRRLQEALDSAKWNLWHGKVDDALERLEDVDAYRWDFASGYPKFAKLGAVLREFRNYLRRNRFIVPD